MRQFNGITDSMDMGLGGLQELVIERGTEGRQVCVPSQPRGPFVLLLN